MSLDFNQMNVQMQAQNSNHSMTVRVSKNKDNEFGMSYESQDSPHIRLTEADETINALQGIYHQRLLSENKFTSGEGMVNQKVENSRKVGFIVKSSKFEFN